MKKLILLLITLIFMSGCAGTGHHRSKAENDLMKRYTNSYVNSVQKIQYLIRTYGKEDVISVIVITISLAEQRHEKILKDLKLNNIDDNWIKTSLNDELITMLQQARGLHSRNLLISEFKYQQERDSYQWFAHLDKEYSMGDVFLCVNNSIVFHDAVPIVLEQLLNNDEIKERIKEMRE